MMFGEKPHKGTIKYWSIDDSRFDRPVVLGRVFGHPQLRDGDWIRTSYIVNMNDEETILETRNSIYTLAEKEGK